ncbi:NAD-dependent epimerase/dehydratase family protein [Marinilabiliaceae bacterium ANBcel2]|nr:NAD-dependent epimerase/dehydratase family protein [Marinilabiliaceae bacterium ANBcel2]
MNSVLVTGANSLLGVNLVLTLLKKGYNVKGVVRRRESFPISICDLNFELLCGDISNSEFVRSSLKDCGSIIHIAAVTSPSLLRYRDYKEFNVNVTQMLIELACEEGVHSFIYVSSANAFGYGDLSNPGSELSFVDGPFNKSFYALSKIEAQNVVLSYSEKIRAIVLNPSFMIGPYDSKPSSGTIVLMGYGKKVILAPPGGKNFVNVKDVAQGVEQALNKGENGNCYLLTGENLSYRDFFSLLNSIYGYNSFVITIPKFLLLFIGLIGDFLRFFKIAVPWSYVNMKILTVRNFYHSAKAIDELGYSYNRVVNGIKEAVEWFKNSGKI